MQTRSVPSETALRAMRALAVRLARAAGSWPSVLTAATIAAHGTQTMPVWGKVFSDKGARGRVGAGYSRRAAIQLKRYLETIQTK